MKPQAFDDIVVYPTQGLLRPPFMLLRGGPDWPRFWTQVAARTCRLRVPVPLDRPPQRGAAVTQAEPVGVWCGPVTEHFGHAIASFGARIAWSSRMDKDIPLIFSARDPNEAVPAFLYQILAHFGVAPDRVRCIRTPTRFARLYVFPQAERLFGGAPSADYLDLLDGVAGPAPPPDGSRIYVSRGGLAKGRIAGEAYLESVLRDAGYTTMRPEALPLDAQLAAYRQAAHLVFSEGSAVHALQLLGRIPARVTIVVRRPGNRLAATAVTARAAAVDHVECLRGLVHGVRGDGRRQRSAGISVLDETRCVAAMARAGIDIAAFWDSAAYVAARDSDIRDWTERRLALHPHGDQANVIRRNLARIGLDVPSAAVSA